ncbi:hypothetical protein ACE0DR_28915 [Azotobacter sp. CWF10]
MRSPTRAPWCAADGAAEATQIGQMAGAASGMDAQQQQMMMSAMGYGYLPPHARSHETQPMKWG